MRLLFVRAAVVLPFALRVFDVRQYNCRTNSFFAPVILLAFALVLPGCGKKPEPPARRGTEISAEQRSLNALFLTEKTHKEVIAPQNTKDLIDPETGETIWPALKCNNPDCPGKDKGQDGRPFLFICPNPSQPMWCPECLKTRNRDSETQKDLIRYTAWVQPYVLPETAQRIKQLEAERKRRILRDEAV